LQGVNSQTHSLLEILRTVTIDIVINTILGRLTLDHAGRHCLFVTGRMPQSGKLPVLDLLTGQKIRFFGFLAAGRLVAPIHLKLGRADGHVGPLGCAKFDLNRHRGWECGPKISKISTFW